MRCPRPAQLTTPALLLAAVVALALTGCGGGSAGDQASASGRTERAADAVVPRPRAVAVEPSAGDRGGVTNAPEAPETGAAAAAGAVGRGAAISPGAPTDAEVKREVEDLQREQARVKRILLAAHAPLRRGSGRFIWPVSGPITSPFCEHRSYENCHPGIDIGVPSGTPIRVADDGQVVLAGPTGGYGNFTCVQHTIELATCYAHQSQILVRLGQVVRQGEVIGLIGCTGSCTGPHLHFEVRVRGRVTDPLAYL